MFPTSDGLKEHYTTSHADLELNAQGVSTSEGSRKRKAEEEDHVTPIIVAMPPEIARKNRPVYDGPSRSLSIAQGRARKRGKG